MKRFFKQFLHLAELNPPQKNTINHTCYTWIHILPLVHQVLFIITFLVHEFRTAVPKKSAAVSQLALMKLSVLFGGPGFKGEKGTLHIYTLWKHVWTVWIARVSLEVCTALVTIGGSVVSIFHPQHAFRFQVQILAVSPQEFLLATQASSHSPCLYWPRMVRFECMVKTWPLKKWVHYN